MTFLLALALAVSASVDPVIIGTADLGSMPDTMLVDARKASAFAEGHIPGATNLDVEALSETRDGVIGMLKLPSDLLPLFAQAGLAPDKNLVVYSGLDEASGVKQATRLFWALEYSGYKVVRLLDGGLAKWKAEGRPVETGPGTVAAIPVQSLATLTPDEARVATRDRVKAFQKGKSGLLVDLRPKDNFTGKSKSDFVTRAGHIPGAKSEPAATFVEGPHFTFKSPEAIRELIGAGSQAGNEPVVTYCNSGRDATVGYVAYRVAGYENVSVYDGSMAEWGNDVSCPMADGEE